MTKRLLTLIVAATLAACTTTQRQGPPAPVVTAGEPRPAPVEAAPPPSPPKRATPRPVEVYAYRPPSEAARIPEEVEPAPEPMDAAEPEVEPGSDSEIVAPDVLPPNVAPVVAAAPPPKVPAPSPAAPPAPEVAAAQSTSGGAARPADALRIQADQQRQAGDYAGAAATLERALRIQPQDALLWNRLARVRMEQGLHSQAANLAAKSNVYAGDQAGLRQDNWSIIATARRQAGDAAGAEEAERKARGA